MSHKNGCHRSFPIPKYELAVCISSPLKQWDRKHDSTPLFRLMKQQIDWNHPQKIVGGVFISKIGLLWIPWKSILHMLVILSCGFGRRPAFPLLFDLHSFIVRNLSYWFYISNEKCALLTTKPHRKPFVENSFFFTKNKMICLHFLWNDFYPSAHTSYPPLPHSWLVIFWVTKFQMQFDISLCLKCTSRLSVLYL